MCVDMNGLVVFGDFVDLVDGGDGYSWIGVEGDCGGYGLGGVVVIY